jgi:hypothetical protein
MVRIKRAKVSASKSRLTVIRRSSADTTSNEQVPVALDPSHLHINQSFTLALSLDFHPAPSEPTLQFAGRQIVFMCSAAVRVLQREYITLVL